MASGLNWAGNHAFVAERIHRPGALDDVRRAVAGARHIHAVGARHAFNGAADSPGELIDLSDIDPDFVLDTAARTVTAGGGATYAALAGWLQVHGWALHNMASLPHLSLAGATATGTHGSGDALGTLASAIAAVELVTATGDVLTLRRGDHGFPGVAVGLGAFGIITRVTLDIQPSYRMRQDAFQDLPWQFVMDEFDAVMGAGTSVSIFTSWSGANADRLWIKTRMDAGSEDRPPVAPGGAVPAALPSRYGGAEHLRKLTPFGLAGPWSERVAHFRPTFEQGPQLQSEYLLPRTQATRAIALLRRLGPRIDAQLGVTEIRSMTADDLWFSPAYGAETIGIHFSWALREVPEVMALCAEIEAMLLPLGARPHWGKVILSPAAALAPLYPRMWDFRALAARLDPAGKFRNAFLDRHVFG